MLSRRALVGLLASGALAGGRPRALGASMTSWDREDALGLIRFAEATHPDGALARQAPEWRRLADALISASTHGDSAAHGIATLKLLAWFRDGHTRPELGHLRGALWQLRLPLRCKAFHDGLYVTSAKAEALPLLGGRLEAVNGAPTVGLIRRFAAIWPGAGAAWAHRWCGALLSSPAFLHGFGVASGAAQDSIELEYLNAQGNRSRARITPQADGSTGQSALQRSMSAIEKYANTQNYGPQPDPSDDGRNFVHRLDQGQGFYVSLDRMSADDFGKPFAVFDNELSNALADSDAPRLILDLRRNGGGDNTLCEPLRKRIAHSRYNRPGGLIVLIAPHTFSAAQNLATRLERETFALFVGEPTGSSPNHCGDARAYAGRSGNVLAYVSTLRWMDSAPDDHRSAIVPDIMTPVAYADYVNGRDPGFEAALADLPARPASDSSWTQPWTRPSQLQVWRPFWKT